MSNAHQRLLRTQTKKTLTIVAQVAWALLLIRKTTMELRIGTTGHLGYGIVQKLTFARFLASFDFRLFQHYPVESRCARYAVRCPVIPEADFVFDSRDVRLLVSPDRGSAGGRGLAERR